ncbi:MAG: hypothetical protein QOJ40_1756, partial [Verrucomicrobiota bacterium]
MIIFKWNQQALAAGRRIRVFCASLSDVFDSEIDPKWREELWDLIRRTPALMWLILTKRANLISKFLPDDWGQGWARRWRGTGDESV